MDRVTSVAGPSIATPESAALARVAMAALEGELAAILSGEFTIGECFLSRIVEGMRLMALFPEWSMAALAEIGAGDFDVARQHLGKVPALFPIEVVS